MLALHDDATSVVPRVCRKARLLCGIAAGRRSVGHKLSAQSGISLLQSSDIRVQSTPRTDRAGREVPGRTGSGAFGAALG
jgi:hypothetical protein